MLQVHTSGFLTEGDRIFATWSMLRCVPLVGLSEAYLSDVAVAGGLKDTHTTTTATPPSAPTAPSPSAAAVAASGAAADDACYCRASGVRFESAAALRAHYHTDWYRYNLKRAARALPPVSTEEAFDALVENGELEGGGGAILTPTLTA